MRVSEKSLELNVGSEFLDYLRGTLGLTKAYLRGLTQREERAEGVDFYAQMNPSAAIFAFQFKAPVAHRPHREDTAPYRFTLQREQHSRLVELTGDHPSAVFYVFPFFATPAKLQYFVPELLADTWLLPVSRMRNDDIFEGGNSKRIRCYPGRAEINPTYEMENAKTMILSKADGINIGEFSSWYKKLRGHPQDQEGQPKDTEQGRLKHDEEANGLGAAIESIDGAVPHSVRKHSRSMSPQIVRGMRIAIVE